ncbi:FG-GAP-like repeat-containing protein [Microbulbifer pacificus]|uniref:FG-GAP-like repeat-containing protein n=1 Tax=Microbulbifer pacificus TaxID=407164 RepID=UPI00131A290F|nr:FG-GAP-like repeat-containing protein [Microbulbifer pacificus]
MNTFKHLLLPLAVTSSFMAPAAQASEIEDLSFVDASLEACLDQHAADNGWTSIGEVTYLYCAQRGIRTLEGIEALAALTDLDIGGNPVENISPLAGLSDIGNLNAWDTRISDLSPLVGKNISRIDLNNAWLKDLPDLGGTGYNNLGEAFPALDTLHLNGNALQDDDIARLPEIASLNLLTVENNLFTDGGAEDQALEAAIPGFSATPLPITMVQAGVYSQNPVDLNTGDKWLDFAVEATGADIYEACVWLYNPSKQGNVGYCDSWQGSAYGQGQLMAEAERGEWILEAHVNSDAGWFAISKPQLEVMGFGDLTLMVNGDGAGDNQRPEVTNLAFSADTVDLDSASNGFVAVDVSVQINDHEGAGFLYGGIEIYNVADPSQRKQIDLRLEQTQAKLVFHSNDMPGTWRVEYVHGGDFGNNGMHEDTSTLAGKSFQTEFTVINSNPAPIEVTSLSFSDSALEACVHSYGGYVHEMTWLGCGSGDISDLEGIQQLFMLQDLDLNGGGYFTNLWPVAQLPHLISLHFAGASVSDLSPLASLNLNALNISWNPIADFSALESIPTLQALWADGSNMTALPSFASPAKAMDVLEIGSNGFNNLGATEAQLAEMRRLNGLSIWETGISNLWFVSGYYRLNNLLAWGNQISDISALASQTQLSHVNLSYNLIEDISGLANSPLNADIILNDNRITDLSPLSGKTEILSLDVSRNRLTDISVVSSLTGMWWMRAEENAITSIPDLSALENINGIGLNHNAITDVTPLTVKTWDWVEVYGNAIPESELGQVNTTWGYWNDAGRPNILSVDVNPRVIALGDNDVEVTAQMITDDQENIWNQQVYLHHKDTGEEQYAWLDGNTSGSLWMPSWAPEGEWDIRTSFENGFGYWEVRGPALAAMGFDATAETVHIDEHQDSDGDGYTDLFELQYGLNPYLAGDATGDDDSDGFSNLHEAVAGTDRGDFNSQPSAMANPGAGRFLLHHPGTFAYNGFVLDLAGDGAGGDDEGRFAMNNGSAHFVWSHDGNAISGSNNGSYVNSDDWYVDELGYGTEVEEWFDTIAIFEVQSGDVPVWKVIATGRLVYPGEELADKAFVSEIEYQVFNTGSTASPIIGAGTYATKVGLGTDSNLDPNFVTYPSEVVLNGDTSGHVVVPAEVGGPATQAVTWSTETDGTLVLDYSAENARATTYFVETFGKGTKTIVLHEFDSAAPGLSGRAAAVQTMWEEVTITGLEESDVIGRLENAPEGDANGMSTFAFVFNEGGLGYQENLYDGVWYQGAPFSWEIAGNTVIAHYYRDENWNYYGEPDCQGATECYEIRRRFITANDAEDTNGDGESDRFYITIRQGFDNFCFGQLCDWQGYVGQFVRHIPAGDFDGDGVNDDLDLDDDNDGLTDQFELDNGLNPHDGSDALADDDSDGFSNLHEIIVGTDRNDGASTPIAMSNPGAGRFLLTTQGAFFNGSAGNVIDLEGDGIGGDDQGRMAFWDGSALFTWEHTVNAISATNNGGYVNRDWWWVDEIGMSDEIEHYVDQLFIYQQSDDTVPTWKVVVLGHKTYASGLLADEPFVDVYEAQMIGGGSIAGAAPAITEGSYATDVAMHEYYNIVPTNVFMPTKVLLSNDGSGEVDIGTELSGDGNTYVEWNVDGDGSLILSDQNSNARTTIYFVETFGKGVKTIVFHEYDTAEGIYGRAAANDSLWVRDEVVTLSEADVIGTFLDVPESANEGVSSFGLQFAPGGKGTQGYWDGESYNPNTPFLWHLDGNVIIMEYYSDQNGYYHDSADCNGDWSCYKSRERNFIVSDREDRDENGYNDRHYVTIRQAFNYCGTGELCDWQGYVSQFDRLFDADNDGLPDAWEAANGLNPTDGDDAYGDTDGDGLSNADEFALGTSAGNADSDADGLSDGEELAAGLNPLDGADAGADYDNDGYSNYEEILAGTNFNDIGDFPAGDLYYSMGIESDMRWNAGLEWMPQDNGQNWHYRNFAAFGNIPMFIDGDGTQTTRAGTESDFNIAERYIDISGQDGTWVSTYYGWTGCPAGEENCVSQINFDGNFWSRSDGSEGMATSDRNLLLNTELVEAGDQSRYTWSTFRIRKPQTLELADITGVWHISNWGREYEREGSLSEGHYTGNADWQFNGDGTCQQVVPFEYHDAFSYFDGQNLASSGVEEESGEDGLESCSYSVDPVRGRVIVDVKLGGDDENSVIELQIDAAKQRMINVYMDDEEWGVGAGIVMLIKKGDVSAYASNAALNGTAFLSGNLNMLDTGSEGGTRFTGLRVARTIIDFDGNGATDGEGYNACTVQRVEKFQGMAMGGYIGVDAWQEPWKASFASYPEQCRYKVNPDGTVDLQQGDIDPLASTTLHLDANGEILTATYVNNGFSEMLLGVVLNGVADPVMASVRFTDFGYEDTDSDGLPDNFEIAFGLDLNADDSAIDLDEDGLSNLEEFQANTNPRASDSDSDGMDDAFEVANNLDPTVDDAAQDADSDGATNLEEFLAGTDPRDAGSVPGGDSHTVDNDFDGDGKSDLFWRRGSDGQPQIWFMDGHSVLQNRWTWNVGSNWEFRDSADFNGDGKADIMWQNASGQVKIWLMDGHTIVEDKWSWNQPTSWSFVATGDFNGDNKSDILWKRNSDGQLKVWQMNGHQVAADSWLPANTVGWDLKDVADFNGDRKADILWQRSSDGQPRIWFMDGFSKYDDKWTWSVGTTWVYQASGDLDGDGDQDIVWLRPSDGQTKIWLMNGHVIQDDRWAWPHSGDWSLDDIRDFDGDGKADILWHRNSDNLVKLWFMNGTSVANDKWVGFGGSGWELKK